MRARFDRPLLARRGHLVGAATIRRDFWV